MRDEELMVHELHPLACECCDHENRNRCTCSLGLMWVGHGGRLNGRRSRFVLWCYRHQRAVDDALTFERDAG